MISLDKNLENKIQEVLRLQSDSILRLRNSSAQERILKIKSIQKYLDDHKEQLFKVLYDDFKKPQVEVYLAELTGIKHEVDNAVENLTEWIKPKKVSTPLVLASTQSFIQYESKGLALIISPWNYPLNLSICPLIQAIASGNAVVLKPSELSPNTSGFISQMIQDLFGPNEVAVFEGDGSIASYLTEQKFNHIYFTGSPAIGKIVMGAAAKNLTSVTLELGGKSPAIVHSSADIKASANKIAWGKFLNNGQTCIAPDYVLVHESKYHELITYLKEAILEFYGQSDKTKDYARIVNNRHFLRIKNLYDLAINHGAQLEIGGEFISEENFISPTVLTNIHFDMEIMHEEIFGPLLPVLTFKEDEEIIHYLQEEEKPLALYIFSKNNSFNDYILKHTSAGGSVINDCLIHFGHMYLPFGGVNNSGIGKSGGHFGFLEFSNQRAVVKQKSNLLKLLYPPYTSQKNWLVKQIYKWF